MMLKKAKIAGEEEICDFLSPCVFDLSPFLNVLKTFYQNRKKQLASRESL